MGLQETDSDYKKEIFHLKNELEIKDAIISHYEKIIKAHRLMNEKEFLDKAAIAAMNGLIIAGHRNGLFKEVGEEEIAEWSYHQATELLVERKRLRGVDNGTN